MHAAAPGSPMHPLDHQENGTLLRHFQHERGPIFGDADAPDHRLRLSPLRTPGLCACTADSGVVGGEVAASPR